MSHYRVILLIFCMGAILQSNGQDVLDGYVRQAVENNLRVRQKQINEREKTFALQRAQKLYGPEVGLLTTYTLASGGRNIDLPIGTLLNNVYSTLNDLTGTQDFPRIEDQTVTFLPNNFYDARLHITQPILRPEIKYNRLIREEEVTLAGLMTAQTTRELIHDVKQAYFSWMQARQAIDIYEQGIALLEESRRVTESLRKNGMAVPSSVVRIESEISHVRAQQQEAQANLKNAAAYFNFLIERPGDAEIIADTFAIPSLSPLLDVSSREELAQIRTGMRISEHALNLEQKHFAPRLGAQVDIGSQAYGFDWGGYVLGGVQLEIPIWDNKKSQLQRQEYKASLESSELKYAWTQNAFATALSAEQEQLNADITIYESYSSLLASNEKYYRETERRYKEGLANYIELLDARTQVTNTQLEQNLAKYQAWIRQNNIERISATQPIE